jgi:hypothetical protein
MDLVLTNNFEIILEDDLYLVYGGTDWWSVVTSRSHWSSCWSNWRIC